MDRRIKKLAGYLGLAADEPSDPLRLEQVRPAFVSRARSMLVLAVVSAACVVIAFDWKLAPTAAGAALGTVIWGAVYFFDNRDRIPRGTLLEPPPGAVVERSAATPLRGLAVAVPLCVGLAWLADRWGLGAVFVPGQFLGRAAASVAGAVLVGRWERANSSRVLALAASESPEDLYAISSGRASP